MSERDQNVERTGKVSVQKFVAGQVEQEVQYIDVPFFEVGTYPAYSRFDIDYTRQLKQFEPIKISVSVSLPCQANSDAIRDSLNLARDLGTEKLGEARKKIDSLVKSA